MRRCLLILISASSLLGFAALVSPQCPEDPMDSGICDTIYVEIYPPDTLFSGFVRVPIFVTHDVPDPAVDSLGGFTIPLCYTRTNPSKYCSVSYRWNNTSLYPSPDSVLERSLFRHLIDDGDTLIHNWMMDQSQRMIGVEWSSRFVLLDGTSYFRFVTRRLNPPEQFFGEGSRVLLATITFRTEDTMTVCLEPCLWPPENVLRFLTRWASSYAPRHNMPYCFSLSYSALGDVNADGVVNIGDVVYMINYLYRQGPAPPASHLGDVNCDGTVDIGDVVFLINYLFRGGPAPSC